MRPHGYPWAQAAHGSTKLAHGCCVRLESMQERLWKAAPFHVKHRFRPGTKGMQLGRLNLCLHAMCRHSKLHVGTMHARAAQRCAFEYAGVLGMKS